VCAAPPCWIFGQLGGPAAEVAQVEFGLPLSGLRNLVQRGALPRAAVAASVLSVNDTAAELEVSATGAVALYVLLSSGEPGTFMPNAFHVRNGERRHVMFASTQAWDGPPLAFGRLERSLRVDWFNA
jgi:hypothetical protein